MPCYPYLRGSMQHTVSRQIPAAASAPPYESTPFPRGKSTLGVIYGVLLWADMNAATPLGRRGALQCPWHVEEGSRCSGKAARATACCFRQYVEEGPPCSDKAARATACCFRCRLPLTRRGRLTPPNPCPPLPNIDLVSPAPAAGKRRQDAKKQMQAGRSQILKFFDSIIL